MRPGFPCGSCFTKPLSPRTLRLEAALCHYLRSRLFTGEIVKSGFPWSAAGQALMRTTMSASMPRGYRVAARILSRCSAKHYP